MFDELKYIIVIKYLIYNLKMNFCDYSIQEVNELAGELAEFLAKYSKEKLKGFSEKEKIIISTTALENIIITANVFIISSGMISFDDFLKIENETIEFIKNQVKKNKK